MEWLTAHISIFYYTVGAAVTLWTLLTRTKRAIRHAIVDAVDDKFASKQDFGRLEAKLDALYQVVMRANHAARKNSIE